MTVRRFGMAVLLTAVLAILFQLLAMFETAIAGESMVIESGFGGAMQFVGIPHFIIGFLFMVTSRRLQNSRSRMHIIVLLLLGVGLCGLFFVAGGPKAYPRLPMVAVLAYFLIHELRDEHFFYQCYGEAPRVETPIERYRIPVLLLAFYLALAGLLWSVQFVKPDHGDTIMLSQVAVMTASERLIWWLASTLVVFSLVLASLRWVKKRLA